MESSGLLVVALFGVIACSAQPSTGVGVLPSDAGAAGAESGGTSGDAGASGSALGGTEAGGTSSGGAAGSCGVLAAPIAWPAWPMPNPVHSGLPNPMSYAVSASGNQVTDKVTGLIWQRQLETTEFAWADAKQYCSCLMVDGVGGWRLPSRIELTSLADWTALHPSIDVIAFPNTPSEAFWSSSVLENGDPDLAWHVDFDSSHTSYTDKLYAHRARCVRGAEDSPANAPPARYTVANGTVKDTQTKLTWEQAVSPASYTWADAATYCAGLSLDGAGWRVPAIGELQTIVDESTNPAADATAFPMTPSEYFWSSSAVVDDPSRAWDTFFANGSTYSFAMTMSKSVRCVR